LAQPGCDFILAACDKARLEALCARLTSETGRYVTALQADVDDQADLAKRPRMESHCCE